jgi:hypothetical protein
MPTLKHWQIYFRSRERLETLCQVVSYLSLSNDSVLFPC